MMCIIDILVFLDTLGFLDNLDTLRSLGILGVHTLDNLSYKHLRANEKVLDIV